MTAEGTDGMTDTGRSLSIVIPAYCEVENILDTLDNVTRALEGLAIPHEVLVIDDGSTDGTTVRLLVNPHNMGFGWSYRRGVEAAALAHIVMVHGDNAWGHQTLREFFSHVGEADIIIGYTRAMSRSRTWTRTAVSKTFTGLVNLITRHRLHYFNGLQIHQAAVLKSLQIESLRLTKTYREVPMDLIERTQGASKAFTVKNLVDVVRTLRLLHAVGRTSEPARPVVRVTGR
jgi:glycosyltransferase involved in cell wall biosynthesis